MLLRETTSSAFGRTFKRFARLAVAGLALAGLAACGGGGGEYSTPIFPWSPEQGRRDSEGPEHRVTIGQPFAVGVYEVTFDEWEACVSGGWTSSLGGQIQRAFQ